MIRKVARDDRNELATADWIRERVAHAGARELCGGGAEGARPNGHQSYLSAVTGSTRAARQAGIEPAASATVAIATNATSITTGSRPCTPKSRDCAARPMARAPSKPK